MRLGAEDRLHSWLRQQLVKRGFDRIGDDGAILPVGGPWAVTQDQQIENIHFPVGLDPMLIARRLIAVNLSDLAAMGARPVYAFLALSCPIGFDTRRFFRAFVAACQRSGVELAGGDLSRNDKVAAALTLLGTRPKGSRWLSRGNGEPGDQLWIIGSLGLSAVGRRLLERGAWMDTRRVRLPPSLALDTRQTRLAKAAIRLHLAPLPQIQAGHWLAKRTRAAAIDVSDGLAIDLHRLCRESDVGALLWAAALPRDRAFDSLCHKLDLDPLATLLNGGEDYALLFALPPRVRPPTDWSCRKLGSLRAESQILLEVGDRRLLLPAGGWDHFA